MRFSKAKTETKPFSLLRFGFKTAKPNRSVRFDLVRVSISVFGSKCPPLNHVELRGLTLHAWPRDPPSSRVPKGTHPSRGSTVRAPRWVGSTVLACFLALIPCRIIKETGHTAHFQQHRYCPKLDNYHLHNPPGVGFYHKRPRVS